MSCSMQVQGQELRGRLLPSFALTQTAFLFEHSNMSCLTPPLHLDPLKASDWFGLAA